MFSPRKLMQRASRAFGRSRRRKHAAAPAAADGGDVDSPRSVVSKGSDAESVFSLDDQITADGAAAAKQEEEVVPEKIIHEANPSPAPVAAEDHDEGRKDTPEKEEEPKKQSVDPAPEDDVADEIVAAKEAVKEQREEEIKAEVVKRFQGRRVRTTSTERRDSVGSNEAIEEARTKLLELRQGNKVKALVGAFETVMDGNHRRAAAGKPQLNLRI
jgi:chromatin segregation and condensation protein Rec8/ScpA/Scc1 (kleisin family)